MDLEDAEDDGPSIPAPTQSRISEPSELSIPERAGCTL